MNVIMDVLMIPMYEYVYPKAVNVALAITCILVFGGLAGATASYFVGLLLDVDSWNITKTAFAAMIAGVVMLLVLVPIMMFTGTKA